MSGAGIGYRKHPVKADINDVTLSRAINVIYRNTTGRPIMCLVTCACQAAAAESAHFDGMVENVTPPTVRVSRAGIVTGQARSIFSIATFVVANGEYYKVDQTAGGGSSVTLHSWIEVTL